MTVKLRSGLRPGDTSGVELAVRLVEEAGVAAIAFHPRSAVVGHKGAPDYALVREVAARVEVPVIVSGGLDSAAERRRAYELSGADALMVARGCFGNPWIFEELTGRRETSPGPAEIAEELLWVVAGAEEHLGEPGPPATCASSTPGTRRGWGSIAATRTSSSASPTSRRLAR